MMSDKKEPNCAFCEWEKIKTHDDFRWLDEKEDYHVILAKEPKIMGHTLVMSKNITLI